MTKYTHKAEINTGNGIRTVEAKIIEDDGSGWVEIEFPHPTVRRFKAKRIVRKTSLTPIK